MPVQDVGGGTPTAAPQNRPQTRPTTPPTHPGGPSEAGPGQLTRVGDLRQQTPRVGEPGQGQAVLARQGNAAATARGELLTDPDRIMQYERSRPGVREAYARLSPEQRTQFDQLVRAQIKDGTQVNTAAPSGMGGLMGGCAGSGPAPGPRVQRGNAARQGLYAGLANGRLLQTDSQGHTTLDNLHDLATQQFASGVDGPRVLSETMAQVGTGFGPPAQHGTQQGGALQTEMASQHPADFVRQVAGLTSPGGEAQVGGSTVHRPRGTTGSMSDIYQTSTRDVATGELLRSEMARNPAASQAYQRMSEADRARVDGLLRSSVPQGEVGPMPKFGTPESERWMREQGMAANQNGARQNVYSLLEGGRMGSRDSQGHTLLDNLDHLRTEPLAAGLDRRRVMGDVLAQTAHPELIQQGNKGTCTVTTIENMVARRQPAEYVRLMSGLATPEGRVTLRNGQTLTRDQGVIPDDNNPARSQMSRVFQASMMEFANGSKTYDNATDAHSESGGRQILNRHGRTVSGLDGQEWERALDAVVGPSTDHNADRNSLAAIQAGLRRGQDVPVGMQWGHDQDGDPVGHALAVTRMDDRYVYLRNPWGAGDQGNTDPNQGPVRESLAPHGGSGFPGGGFGGLMGMFGALPGGGQPSQAGNQGLPGDIRMTREEFQRNLRHYYTLN